MNVSLSQPARTLVLQVFAVLLVCGLPLFFPGDVSASSKKYMKVQTVPQGKDLVYVVEETQPVEPAPAPAPPPVVVRREKGGEPHARFGYERAMNEDDSLKKTSHKIFQYMPDSSALGTENMLAELSQEVAGKIFYELKEEGLNNLSAKVAVVAAVPLSDLKRESEFGRIVAEYYLTDLADRGLQVTELRMGSDINILPQTGEFLLSRNVGEIANNTPALDYVVVSTFSNTRKTLILQGRLISLKSGLVKTSWRYNLPLNRELLSLFSSTDQQPFTIAVKGIGQ
jgi:hypothetical protein